MLENTIETPAATEPAVLVMEEEVKSPLPDEPIEFVDNVKVGECLNITTIKIPKEMENNVSMGHDRMDVLMSGDGATPSTACLVTGVPGAGKCLGKGTPILMYDGTVKLVEDVVVGDLLMGPDSRPRRVLSLARGREEMFEVRPAKGDPWTCNRSHVLSLVYSGKKREHVKNISVDDFLTLGKGTQARYKQYRTGVEFTHETSLSVDPYFVGLWLGDGTLGVAQITTADEPIKNYLYQWANKNHYRVRPTNSTSINCTSYTFAKNGPRVCGRLNRNPLTDFLRTCEKNGEKHIPHTYLTASRTSRLALLAGLIDSDGHQTNGCYDFVSKWENLANQVAFLCRSLGFAAYVKHCTKTIADRDFSGMYYRVSISGNLGEVPVLLERKKIVKRKQAKNALRTGFALRSLGEGDYYGFEIDGDHLFVLGDFTVTHNTTMMLQLADSIMKQGNIALYNTCEESLVQVSRVAKRLRLSHGFYVSSHRSVFDLIAHAKTIQAANAGKQVFLFVDSLQTIEIPNFDYDEQGALILDDTGQPKKRKGRPLNGPNVQVEATKLLTNWCKKTYGIMFLIGQVNKDGEFAGRQAIKHWVDAHLHLDINKDRYSAEYGQRIAEMTKNRFGIAGIYYPFEIEARGIKFLEKKIEEKK